MPRRTPVDLAQEVAPCAKRNCSRCHGRGLLRVNGGPTPCSCAARRFFRLHGNDVHTTDDGNVWWGKADAGDGGALAGIKAGALWLWAFVSSFVARKTKDPEETNGR